MLVERQRLQQNFSRAASDYDLRANHQRRENLRVLEAAIATLPETGIIADIGCGTGYLAAEARGRRPGWRVVGVDMSLGMCAVAALRCHAIAGDAVQLPLADASVDGAVSSLCYQWVEDQPQAFVELARVLKPGSKAVIATLGEGSLAELRAHAAMVQVPLSLLPMRSFAMHQQLLAAAGFVVTQAERRVLTEHYASVGALLESMRSIGAGNNFSPTSRQFVGPKRWAAMEASYEAERTAHGIPATWEHQFFIVRKPA
jgi:malonyl-CoA O-methyltransferase